ncbi:MAG: hypothetical protein JO347_11990 [Candidatus Eremiobacteraeota bacterium]|nr:hypothetical protein [Candidatus Eremiobacteraeota bacterium]
MTAATALRFAPAFADAGVASTLTFSDGAVATTYEHCGDTDLCATVKYPNGDLLSIYSEGAALCQPYYLDFVSMNGATKNFEFSRVMNHDPIPTNSNSCGHSRSTTMVMDHGLVHLTVSENSDGTLRLQFAK